MMLCWKGDISRQKMIKEPKGNKKQEDQCHLTDRNIQDLLK